MSQKLKLLYSGNLVTPKILYHLHFADEKIEVIEQFYCIGITFLEFGSFKPAAQKAISFEKLASGTTIEFKSGELEFMAFCSKALWKSSDKYVYVWRRLMIS